VPPTSEDVVQFIADNVVDFVRENFLDDERQRVNVGFLIGWNSGAYC
jgi:hexokinase